MWSYRLNVLRTLIGGFLVHGMVGTMFSWGNLTVYVTSYFRAYGTNPNITYTETVYILSTYGSLLGFTAMIGGWLHQKIGVRLSTLLGSLIVSGGVALSAYTLRMGFIPFLLSYGLSFGLGTGIVWTGPVKCGMSWLPHHAGFASGFMLMGAGVGAFTVVKLQTMMVNPDNVHPVKADRGSYFVDAEVLDRLPSMFLTLGIIYTVVSLLGCALLVMPGEGDVPKREDEEEEADENGNLTETRDFQPSEMIRTKTFWLIWFNYLLNMQGVFFAAANVKVFGQSQIPSVSDHGLSWVCAIGTLCNGLGRLMWGMFGDQFSFRWALAGISGTYTVFLSTLVFCKHGGFIMYLSWMSVLFLCVGGTVAIYSATTLSYFGSERFASNFGIMVTAGGLAWIQSACTSHLLARVLNLDLVGMSYVAAGCTALALGCAILMPRPETGPSPRSEDEGVSPPSDPAAARTRWAKVRAGVMIGGVLQQSRKKLRRHEKQQLLHSTTVV